MKFNRSALFLGLTLAFLAGCQTVKLPVVLNENPTLAELTQAVNANSAKIQSLRTDTATLGISNVSGWANGQIAFQRPQNVRVIGTATMMGRVVDFGSNSEKFWFWSKYQNPEQILWAPINGYASSAIKETIPVDPVWFPEALGVVEINPSDVIEGPVVQADKTILLVTQRQRPDGLYKKYTYIEAKTAAVKRQDVIGPTGEPIVSVVCDELQQDAATGAILPKKLTITAPKAQGALHLNLGTVEVNVNERIYAELFQLPTNGEVEGLPVQIGSGATPAAPAAPAPTTSPAPPIVAPPAVTSNGPAVTATTPPVSSSPAPAAMTTTTQTTLQPGSGSVGFSPPLVSGETIPVTGTQLPASSEAVATAEFRAVAVDTPYQSMEQNQSYMAPPMN